MIPALEGPDVYFHVFTHSRRPAAADFVSYYDMHPNMIIHDYGVNRGLARSWSDGIVAAQEQGADAIIVINDDVTATRDDLALLTNGCVDHRECGIVTANGFNERMNEWQDLQYAVFGINPVAIEKVGLFDPNYLVIYGEDVDFSRRCALAGVTFYNAGDSTMVHRGSATIGTVPELFNQNQATFPRNEDYHRRKHGGGYNHEVFEHPFNDPTLSWFIGAENRDNPYPEHRRTDADEVVKI